MSSPASGEGWRAEGGPGAGAEDLGNMFQHVRDFERGHCAARDIAFSRGLNPDLQSVETWLCRNKSRTPLETGGAPSIGRRARSARIGR